MEKKYYEVVFEGKADVICGMLEGFILGEGADWEWYTSSEAGVESETFISLIKDWAALKFRLQRFILEEELHKTLQKAVENKGDLRYIKLKYTKSAREIRSCKFDFTANAYAKKFGEEIKAIISSPPDGIKIVNYNPVETIDSTAKEVELYAPVHDYSFKGSGTVTGNFGAVVSFRDTMDLHPLIHVSGIKLIF